MQDSIYFSYWVPYSYSKHRDLVARLQMNEKTRLEVLGQSLDGRDIDLLIVGESRSEVRFYVIGKHLLDTFKNKVIAYTVEEVNVIPKQS